MRPSALIHLFVARLRSRFVQELLALAGITVGVALVFSALVANSSLTGSVEQLASGIVGDTKFQLDARGPGGFDERLLSDVQRIDGVRAAAPILEADANISGPDGRRAVTLVGGDPRFARFGGSLLRNFTAEELARQRAIALPTPAVDGLGLGLYQPVRVETGAATMTLPLGAELQRKDIGPLVHSPVALMPIKLAQEVAGMPGRVSRIYVDPEPGRDDDVEAGLTRLADGKLNVRPALFDVEVFDQAAYPTSQSTAMFSAFSALVGFLFAFTAVLMTVPQRRRLVDDMRMSGYEPWVIVQVLLFDAIVLGTLGSVLGLALGDQLSRHLFGAAPGYLAYAFPIGSQRIVTPASIAFASGAGLVAACVAVLAPLRDILTRHVVSGTAVRSTRRTRRLIVAAGLACLATAVLIVVAAPSAALAGLFALTAALLLLLPTLMRHVTRVFELATQHMKSPVPTLAVLEVQSGMAKTRTIALAATGAVAVFATVAIGGAHADLERGLNQSAAEVDSNAGVWVTMRGTPSAFAVGPFDISDQALADVEAVPGVASVAAYRGSFLDIEDHRVWVQAPPRSAPLPVPPTQLREGDAELAAQRLREGGWVVLSQAIAKLTDAHVGDRVSLPTPVASSFRVAGVSTNIGWPSGSILLNADDYATAWGDATPSALHVQLESGASPKAVARGVSRALDGKVPADVETQAERIDRHRVSTSDGLARLSQISILVLLSAMLAMAAAMGGMIWQRRPALAGLKVHGYSEGELWKALLVESGLLLGTGCLIGAAFGLFGQILLSRALETITGFPVLYSTAGVVAVAILALVTAVAVTMLAIPGWLAVRVQPTPTTSG